MMHQRLVLLCCIPLLAACVRAADAQPPATTLPQPTAAPPPTHTREKPTPVSVVMAGVGETPTTAPTAVPTALPTAVPPTPAPTAQPTASPELRKPVRLEIDEIAIDGETVPVGLDEQHIPVVPRHDIGWYIHSARPGEGENIVFWAHVLRFKSTPNIPAPFARLHELDIGTPIRVHTSGGDVFHYVVTRKIWVTPEQVEYILPQGAEQLTLVSCIGEKVVEDGSVGDMSHRLITIAEPARVGVAP